MKKWENMSNRKFILALYYQISYPKAGQWFCLAFSQKTNDITPVLAQRWTNIGFTLRIIYGATPI